MKAKPLAVLGIACLFAAGCSQSGEGGGQEAKPAASVQAAADDPRIPPEKQTEIRRIMAQQQQATRATQPTAR